jgi:hypothetical protein
LDLEWAEEDEALDVSPLPAPRGLTPGPLFIPPILEEMEDKEAEEAGEEELTDLAGEAEEGEEEDW